MSGLFENFPYSNFHELNLDWVLKTLQSHGDVLGGLSEAIAKAVNDKLNDTNLNLLILNALTSYGVVINVKAPPADLTPATGDGTADDTLAIQGCIDYANANGGKTVFFPSGSYLTQSLTLKDNVSLVGFDRSTTSLVLKGGATQSLLKGTTHNNTISKIKLDGNMSIQVNNIDTVTLTGGDYTFSELEITDGYTLMKLVLDDNASGSNIIYNKGVVDGLVVSGAGSVQFDNIIFNELSTLSGRYIINNAVSNAVYTGIKSVCTVYTAIKNASDKSVFMGQIDNVTTTIYDIGTNTYYDFYSKGNSSSAKIEEEKQARIAGDNALQGAIDAEEVVRANADTALQGAIDAEEVIRANADTALQGAIDAEEVIRANADTALQGAIDAEEVIRANADTALQGEIDNLELEIALKDTFPMVNIKNYGAIGDGITNDTTAIQNAIAEAFNNGVKRTVFIPAGIYLVTQIINDGGVSIVGEGKGSVLKGTDNAKAVIKSSLDFSDVRYENFTIIRSVKAPANSGAHGIHCSNGGMRFIFRDLQIYDCDKGIFVEGATAGGWFDKLFIENCSKEGIHVIAPNMTISNCYCQKNGGDGFRFNNTAGLFIHRCEAYRSKGNGFNLTAEGVQSINDVIITQCVASTNKGHGILLDTNGANIKVSNCFIEYSGFEDEAGSATQLSSGIHVATRNANVEIDAECMWNSQYGISVYCDGFNISGLYVANSLFAPGTYHGIYVPNSSKNFIIHDAICAPTKSTHNNTQSWGIVLEGTPTYFTIHDCFTKGNVSGDYVYWVPSSTGKIHDCIGTNPRGLMVAPAFPAPDTTYTNNYPFSVDVAILGGTIFAIYRNNNVISNTNCVVHMEPGDRIAISYSGTPTWTWIGN